MSCELNRIGTFTGWPKPNIFPNPTQLAIAGFYYSGRGDKVICFSCKGEVSDWNTGMKPSEVHAQRFPNCLLPQDVDGFSDMSYEEFRLMTFSRWPKPNTFPAPSQFVGDGFYYSGSGDLVICFSCKGEVSDWNSRMKPSMIHEQRFPNCLLVQGSEKKNKPFQPTKEVMTRVAEYLEKTPPRTALSSTKDDSGSTSSVSQNYPANAIINLPALVQGTTCDSSDMRYEQARLDTLAQNWPKPEIVRPEDLARAGMFYIGPGDRVQCAFCKGKLEDWIRGEVALDEHRKHFGSRCPFIQEQGAGVGNIPPESVSLPSFFVIKIE